MWRASPTPRSAVRLRPCLYDPVPGSKPANDDVHPAPEHSESSSRVPTASDPTQRDSGLSGHSPNDHRNHSLPSSTRVRPNLQQADQQGFSSARTHVHRALLNLLLLWAPQPGCMGDCLGRLDPDRWQAEPRAIRDAKRMVLMFRGGKRTYSSSSTLLGNPELIC